MEDIKNIILIISGIGTLISAIIAAFTVWEIKKQRESSYVPEIILDNYFATLHFENILKEDSYFRFLPSIKNEKGVFEKNILLPCNFQNIGFGVAKYVEFEWEYNYSQATKMLNTVLPVGYELDIDNANVFLKNSKSNFYTFVGFTNSGKENIAYILPESINGSSKGSIIPQIVTNILSYYLVFKHNLHDSNSDPIYFEEFEGFPILSLKIKYKDIRNKKYVKTFNIKFSVADSKNHPQSDADEYSSFTINVTES